uniref:type VII toxin-antitoxin system HepT family RNase toxin n=1 Tax=Methylohalobius crimeensis TaxID=244365 RepID=UPI000409B33A
MNLQRICELAIDIANHLIKTKKLGLPQDSRDSFALLQRAGLIGAEQMKTLQAMVGLRNILVHEYQELDLKIMVDAIEHRMREVVDFANLALKAAD